MKKIFVFTVFMVTYTTICAQDKFFTKNGKVHFDATVPASPEKIEAVNYTVTCVIDIKTGNIQFSILMKGFQFERALMEEHFNENYVESSKYPKAEFKGLVNNISAVNFNKDGTYQVKVKGILKMHGETKEIETEGKLIIKAGKITATANFPVQFSDYKISIPKIVSDKVARVARIEIECLLDPLK